MIEACSLSSGSNGNSYFVRCGEDIFLVDAGICTRSIESRLRSIGYDLSQIKAVLISHEHSDHVRGLEVLSKRVQVYMTRKTAESLPFKVRNLNIFIRDKRIMLGRTSIIPFSKYHDAVEPCSFAFCHDNKKISIMTDIGTICDNVKSHVNDSDILFLESNYDEKMLKEGNYPHFLKQRIMGKDGHLSNYNAASLVLEHASSKLKHVMLSHLSENNNRPELALGLFTSMIRERNDLSVKAYVASRYCMSDLVRL